MDVRVYHVEKTSLGFTRRYRISADDGSGGAGDPVAYAEKQLRVSDRIVLYRDAERRVELATVTESSAGILAALTGYEVRGVQGERLGSFGVVARKSVARTTWECDQPGLGRSTGTERSRTTAGMRRVVGLLDTVGEIANALTKYHFDFVQDGRRLFSVEKEKVFADRYRLVLHVDGLDPLLLFALVVTMESRQR